jgi:hypothetical protein
LANKVRENDVYQSPMAKNGHLEILVPKLQVMEVKLFDLYPKEGPIYISMLNFRPNVVPRCASEQIS